MALGTQLSISDFRFLDLLDADQSFSVADVSRAKDLDVATQNLLGGLGFSAVLQQPISVRGRWSGILTVLHEAPHTFSQAETAFYRTLADQAALAFEGQRLLEEAQRRAERERTIRQITDKVRATQNLETILQTTVQELSRAMGLPRAFIRLGTEELADQKTNTSAMYPAIDTDESKLQEDTPFQSPGAA
jgi:GAF domain-containing protein